MTGPQQNQEPAPQRAPAPTTSTSTIGVPAAASRRPDIQTQRQRATVYLNRSEEFSTIHGEIPVGDPLTGIMGFQNGLPFNHQDELMHDHPLVDEDPKLRARADKLLARAAKYAAAAATRAPASEVDPVDEEDEDEGEGLGPVNLAAWARGQGDWPWVEITQYIARKYSKRVMDKRGALELCIAENVVTRAQLSRPHQRLLDS